MNNGLSASEILFPVVYETLIDFVCLLLYLWSFILDFNVWWNKCFFILRLWLISVSLSLSFSINLWRALMSVMYWIISISYLRTLRTLYPLNKAIILCFVLNSKLWMPSTLALLAFWWCLFCLSYYLLSFSSSIRLLIKVYPLLSFIS